MLRSEKHSLYKTKPAAVGLIFTRINWIEAAARLLQLPSVWSNFISESTHGASFCLGQLSGLESKKEIYKKAIETLADGQLTTLILVSRPEETPLKEAARASSVLADIGVNKRSLYLFIPAVTSPSLEL